MMHYFYLLNIRGWKMESLTDKFLCRCPLFVNRHIDGCYVVFQKPATAKYYLAYTAV